MHIHTLNFTPVLLLKRNQQLKTYIAANCQMENFTTSWHQNDKRYVTLHCLRNNTVTLMLCLRD